MTPVPVAFVSSHALRGGAEHYLELLLGGLEREWISGVVCLADGPLVGALRANGYPTAVLPTSPRAPGILASAWRLRRLLARTKPAVVHANGVKAALVAALATIATPIPVVWVKHDFSWDGPRARRLARRCAKVVGVSEAVLQTFDGDHGRRASRRPQRAAGSRGRPRRQDGAGSGRRSLRTPAPWSSSSSAASTRTRASGSCSRSHPSSPGRIRACASRWSARHRRRTSSTHARSGRRWSDLGLEQSVRFLGYQDDAAALIAGSDVVLIPSRPDATGVGREGFSYVGLEALTAGTPVVGYAHGGLPEVVGDCGVLVEPGDRAALAAAVRELVEDPDLRERLGRCGRERARELFSLERTVEAMKEHYLDVARAA